MELTLIRAIERNDPRSPALITEKGDTYTYSRLLNSVFSLSAVQEPRCLVFCLCSNTVGSLTGYLACLFAGAVPLLLDDRMDQSLLFQLIDKYKPRALWVPQESAGDFSYCAPIAEQEGYVLLKTGSPVYPMNEALSLLLTTSGSTGSPKLVRQSMKNITANAASIAEYLELDPGERPITTCPCTIPTGCPSSTAICWRARPSCSPKKASWKRGSGISSTPPAQPALPACPHPTIS
jgi:acyl-CoA synthetase (AMP-forming)/AMP-acid ligase II